MTHSSVLMHLSFVFPFGRKNTKQVNGNDNMQSLIWIAVDNFYYF